MCVCVKEFAVFASSLLMTMTLSLAGQPDSPQKPSSLKVCQLLDYGDSAIQTRMDERHVK